MNIRLISNISHCIIIEPRGTEQILRLPGARMFLHPIVTIKKQVSLLTVWDIYIQNIIYE